MGDPIKFVWTSDGKMVPASYWWGKRANQQFKVGEAVEMERWEERSGKSHRHEFAWLRTAWDSLPDHMVDQFPSSEHLRKFALIRTGFCTMTQYPCVSAAEAERWAQNLRPVDPYTIVKSDGEIVTVYTAVSQSSRSMGKTQFQKSKQAIIDYVAGLLNVDPKTLAVQEEPA